jgi:protease I
MKNLQTHRILLFVGDDYEDLELWYPKLRLEEAGAATTLAGQKSGVTYRGKHGYPCTSETAIADVRSQDFTGVVIVGGWMPDKLRRDGDVLKLVREFNQARKMIASICHGPWINISAGICKGVKMTSTPGIRDDLVNAGAQWVDAPVVVDGHVISSRRPPDLPAFGEAIVEYLASQARSEPEAPAPGSSEPRLRA